jgi:hypothetical protein
MVRGQKEQRAVARRKAFLQRRFSLPALSRLLLGAGTADGSNDGGGAPATSVAEAGGLVAHACIRKHRARRVAQLRSPGTPSSVATPFREPPFRKGLGCWCFCRSRTCQPKDTTVAGMTMNILKRIQISMSVKTRLSAMSGHRQTQTAPPRSPGSQEEQCCIAGKVVPAFLRKMKCLVKHEAEEILFRTQTNPQNEGDQCVE